MRLRTMLVQSAVAVAALVGIAAPAHADRVDGVELTVHSDDPMAVTVTLTNHGTQPCQVVPDALGTVVLSRVEQSGAVIEPIATVPSFDDDLGYQLSQQLRTLEPGGSVELRLPLLPIGPTGHAVQTVAWSPQLTLGSLYPIVAGKPLDLQVSYASPVSPAAGPPLCAAVSGVSGAADGLSEDSPMIWTLLGGAIVVLLVGGVLVMLLRRRRRAAAGSVSLVLALGLIGVDPMPAPAAATITLGSGVAEAAGACLASMRAPGGDPRNILPTLDDPAVNVTIMAGSNGENRLNPSNIFVYWDPNNRSPFADGVPRDPCDELYHELYHAFEDTTPQGVDLHECITADGTHTGIAIKEVNATRAENERRRGLGHPQRTVYGSDRLPAGDCRPPAPNDPICHPTRGCPPPDQGRRADSNGDPHVTTFDGRRFGFQAVGEFVAVRDSSSPAATAAFQLQVRQSPVAKSRWVSVNSAVAAAVAGDRVEVSFDGEQLALLVNGIRKPLASTALPTGGEVIFTPKGRGRNEVITIGWPDTSYAMVSPIGLGGLHLNIWAAPARAGKLTGLFGDYDGERSNDIRIGSGEPIAEVTHDALYPGYADSLRIDAASSLFTYSAGASTQTYTDRTFPDRPAANPDEHRRAWAEQLCRRFGVTDPESLSACVIDLINTGRAEFVVSAMATQSIVAASIASAATVTTVQVSKPGEVSTVEIEAKAGQKLYVDVVATTIRDACGVLVLRDPANKTVGAGCIINGKGNIDTVSLLKSGRYTLTIDPPGETTGEAQLRLVWVTDQQEKITIDGPEVIAAIVDSGGVSRLTFAATADQKVYVDVPGTSLADQCGLLSLLDPAGRSLTSGCVIQGRGYLDAVVLPVTGSYTIVVDPVDARTGQAQIRLTSALDQRGTVALNGGEVTATIAQPGAVATFTFAASAGQKVTVVAGASTLPAQCGLFSLRGPAGKVVASGCLINGKGGVTETVLPVTGQYTIEVDPLRSTMGTVSLRVHT